ncbi:MAG: rhodanese-like domain-containing protein [Sediminibacterium sp.]|nr:rhodanese-like domain-containing protein [Sediminibacterium sp.]
MLQTLKNILGIGPKVDLGELIKEGAVIMDVRSREEYASGHVKGSINVPLNQLSSGLKKLKNKDVVIITCCASGMRSASAKGLLKSEGFKNVHNGGSWLSLRKYEKK